MLGYKYNNQLNNNNIAATQNSSTVPDMSVYGVVKEGAQVAPSSAEIESDISSLLRHVKLLLSDDKYEEAFAFLCLAKTLTKNAKNINNKFSSSIAIFNKSINQLNGVINFITREHDNRTPERFAEKVVDDALSEQYGKSLFHVHKNRLIEAIASKVKSSWHLYRGKFLGELGYCMSDLIRDDLREIDFNKWFWRGGFGDHLKLDSSHTVIKDLESMIDNFPLQRACSIDFPIFELIDTNIAAQHEMPVTRSVLFDYPETLNKSPRVIVNFAFDVPSASEIVLSSHFRRRLMNTCRL